MFLRFTIRILLVALLLGGSTSAYAQGGTSAEELKTKSLSELKQLLKDFEEEEEEDESSFWGTVGRFGGLALLQGPFFQMTVMAIERKRQALLEKLEKIQKDEGNGHPTEWPKFQYDLAQLDGFIEQ